MRKWRWIFSIFVMLTLVLTSQPVISNAAPPPPSEPEAITSPPPVQEEVDPALVSALRDRVNVMSKSGTEVLAFVIYETYIDHVIYSQDGQTALLWLALRDPQTGETIATEPGLAIAELDSTQKSPAGDASWDVTLQADQDWRTEFNDLPAELLSDDLKMRYEQPTLADAKDVAPVYRGYKLPWAGGTGRYLTGSIGHFLIYNSCSETSCRYAYDFADGTMFPLLAARGGTVYRYKWDCPNGNTTCSNYLVLEDKSTSPTTYQLYLHNAYDTLPQKLRQIGAPVVQGEYIGNVDDTGYSSGHHLHFHVHTNPTSYWGNSVDVRFDDVSVNDGTPRTCYEAANWPNYGGSECIDDYPGKGDNFYVSGNYGAYPPSGNLIMPADGEVIVESSMLVGGVASDDVGIKKVQTIVRPLGSSDWVEVGAPLTVSGNTFMGEVDMCGSGLPNGPMDISVRIFDYEGNLAPGYPGFRTVMNESSCKPVPQPSCVPGTNQVALFSSANFQGTCQLFGIGDYSDGSKLGSIGDNQVGSLMVGSGVRALLYERSQNTGWAIGRSEAFEADDANMLDNRIGPDQTSAMRVQARTTAPAAAVVNEIFNNYGTALTAEQSYVADFAVYGATEFRGQLSGPVSKTLGWTNHNDWSLGSLPAGNYTLQVWGRNSAGEKSATRTFTIASGSLPAATTLTAPYSANFETGTQNWYATPMWHQEDLGRSGVTTKTWVFNDSFDANAGANLAHSTVGGGDLTSPPIRIPASGYYLRFDYFYESESMYTFWDTRWVQISKDGGPFENVLQLSYDPTRVWMTGPAINLSAYAGSTIRVRFHMDIVDPYFNSGFGWVIDNVAINTTAPASCNDIEPNNRLDQASSFPASGEVFAYICPNGDLDYYRFSGSAGEEVTIDVDAMDFGSQLDPYIFLLDNKGGLLMENDDEEYSVHRDSKILYTLPYSGDYYVLLKAWDHPGVGDANRFYTLRLEQGDLTPPVVSFQTPSDGIIARSTFPLQVSAVDTGSSVEKVDFYYRSADRLNNGWLLLGSDTDGSNGWTANFDPAGKEPIIGGAFYAQAFDGSANAGGALVTITGYDETTPYSQLAPLPASLATTAVHLTWTAGDPDGGLHHFEIQYQENGGAWTTWRNDIPGSAREAYFLGNLGSTYGFRMRAVDQGFNLEDYPASAEATTRILDCSKTDLFESMGDNSASNPPVLPLDFSQTRNFCPTNDTDWVLFDVEAGTEYLIMANSLGGEAAMQLRLYAEDGTTLLAESTSTNFGRSVQMTYDAAQDRILLMQVLPFDSRLAGDDVEYSLWYGEGFFSYMPFIGR